MKTRGEPTLWADSRWKGPQREGEHGGRPRHEERHGEEPGSQGPSDRVLRTEGHGGTQPSEALGARPGEGSQTALALLRGPLPETPDRSEVRNQAPRRDDGGSGTLSVFNQYQVS